MVGSAVEYCHPLPMLAGHVLQTNSISFAAVLMAAAAGALSLVEIAAPRPYKRLKSPPRRACVRYRSRPDAAAADHPLQFVSLGVILLGLGLVAWRWTD